MFNKGMCPLCEKEINLIKKSGFKIANEHICQSCANKLIHEKINILNYKKYSIDELKKIVHDNDIKTGKILECPNCHNHNLELLTTDKNYKEQYKTTINLNPLRIFTLTNTKKIEKEISKDHNEYLCKDCGYRWIGK